MKKRAIKKLKKTVLRKRERVKKLAFKINKGIYILNRWYAGRLRFDYYYLEPGF